MADQGIIRRDGYSGFRFFQCIEPRNIISGTSYAGAAIDLQGYNTATIVVNIGNTTSNVTAASFFQFKLEHANSDADGCVNYSEVYPSQMYHSVVGAAGVYSALASGSWQSIGSMTSFACRCFAVGYGGPRRWLRVVISDTGNPSTYSMGATAILGLEKIGRAHV